PERAPVLLRGVNEGDLTRLLERDADEPLVGDAHEEVRARIPRVGNAIHPSDVGIGNNYPFFPRWCASLRYARARSIRSWSSPQAPRPRLHRLQRTPRTAPVTWSWSTTAVAGDCPRPGVGSVMGTEQMRHAPPCATRSA